VSSDEEQNWKEFCETGIFPDVPYAIYDQWPGLRKTRLWTGHTKTMAHYHWEMEHLDELMDTPSFFIGRATDKAITQPHKFEKLYTPPPPPPAGSEVWDRRFGAHKQAWAEWQAECLTKGWTVISQEDYDLALRLRDAAWANPISRMLLEGAEMQVAMQWHDEQTALLCKALLDVLNRGIIVDIKTARCANSSPFGRDAYRYGYHFGGALYFDGARAVSQREIGEFVLLAIEKEPPYPVLCHQMSPDDLEIGRYQYRTVLQQVAYCLETGEWPAYDQNIVPLQLPGYAGQELSAAQF